MLTANRVRELSQKVIRVGGQTTPLTVSQLLYRITLKVFQFEVWSRTIDKKSYFEVVLRLDLDWMSITWPKENRFLLESEEAVFQSIADFINKVKVEDLQGLINTVLDLRISGQSKPALERVTEGHL